MQRSCGLRWFEMSSGWWTLRDLALSRTSQIHFEMLWSPAEQSHSSNGSIHHLLLGCHWSSWSSWSSWDVNWHGCCCLLALGVQAAGWNTMKYPTWKLWLCRTQPCHCQGPENCIDRTKHKSLQRWEISFHPGKPGLLLGFHQHKDLLFLSPFQLLAWVAPHSERKSSVRTPMGFLLSATGKTWAMQESMIVCTARATLALFQMPRLSIAACRLLISMALTLLWKC